LGLGRIVAFFPFFLIGYKLNPEKAEKFINGRKPAVNILGAVITAGLLYCAYRAVTFFHISQSALLMSEYKDTNDAIVRLVLFVVAAAIIVCLAIAIPSKSIPFVGKWGKNSLAIFLLHRVFTILFAKLLPAAHYNRYYIIFALIATIITLLVFGLDIVSKLLNTVLDKITDILCAGRGEENSKRLLSLQSGIALLIIGILLLSAFKML
jgi:fucose 4-O-acetylase-like acetyltransferase